MKVSFLTAGLLAVAPAWVVGQSVTTPASIKWGAAPAVLPAGAKAVVLEGDPSQAGPFAMRIMLPAGYTLPPHFHPVTEHVTVIQGTFLVGMGETLDESKFTELPAGTYGVIPPGMRHFARAKGEVVIQLHGVGPWGLTYVNPNDDPRGRATP